MKNLLGIFILLSALMAYAAPPVPIRQQILTTNPVALGSSGQFLALSNGLPVWSNVTASATGGVDSATVSNIVNNGPFITRAAGSNAFGTNTSFEERLNFNRLSVHYTNVAVPSAPTVAVGAAGVLAGVYSYAVAFVTTNGETPIGINSTPQVNPISEMVDVTIAVGAAGLGVIARKVYRSDENGDGMYLLTNILNNTTTSFTDNVPDSGLGLPPQRNNTTAGRWYVNGVPILFIDIASGNMYAGTNAGLTNLLGINNVAYGGAALMGLSNGNNNVAIGGTVLRDLRIGDANTGVGGGALDSLILGEFNMGIGQDSLTSMTNGFRNVGVGRDTLWKMFQGTDNTAIGDVAGEELRRGTNNTYVGSHADGPQTNSNSGAIGHYSKIEKNRQLVIGTTNAAISYTQAVFNIAQVGFGTNNPQKSLHVVGDVRFTGPLPGYVAGAPDDGAIMFVNPNGDVRVDNRFVFNTNSGSMILGNTAYNDGFIITSNSGSFPFYIFSSGLGINTNNPNTTFDIFSNDSDGALRISNPHGKTFAVLTNGNVGIGTNNPTSALHIRAPVSSLKILEIDGTNGSPLMFFGIYPGFPGIGTIFNGYGTNAANAVLYFSSTDTVLNAPTTLEFQSGGASQLRVTSTGIAPLLNLAKDVGTAALSIRTNYSGWLTKINENILTNTVTAAATLYVDLGTNQVQFLKLAGDSTLHTTNRTGSAGFRGTTVFVQGAATNCVLTLNTNWINFGTNNTVTALANKWMVFTFGVKGTAEGDVLCSYDNQKN